MAEPLHRRVLNQEIDGVLVAFDEPSSIYVVSLSGIVAFRSCNPEHVWRTVQLMRNSYRYGQIDGADPPAETWVLSA